MHFTRYPFKQLTNLNLYWGFPSFKKKIAGRKKGILIQITEKIDHAVDYWKLNKYLNKYQGLNI